MVQHAKNTEIKSLLDLQKTFPTEEACREELAKARWNGKPVCVHCGSSRKIYKIAGGRLYKCADCRKPFSVKMGTIFEDSALPLQKWFMALWFLSAHKKGVSSMQLSRDINVTQKTAWFMLHRIRYAMKTPEFNKPMNGTVEVDETFIGGKTHGQGRGYMQPNKTAVFGMAERNGEIRAQSVKHADGKTLKPIIRENIDSDAIISSDEFGAYKDLDKEFKNHVIVIHSQKEYVNGIAHTNNIEGFWSILKRGIYGIYHSASKKHIDKYVDEFEYRYNTRKMKDAQRFNMILNRLSGHLTYVKLISEN
ncbi:MAG: IS1595 family transposase [Acidobacteria bacterium]|nr:IS1595 family transposase [Acidobacteriota bacterium]